MGRLLLGRSQGGLPAPLVHGLLEFGILNCRPINDPRRPIVTSIRSHLTTVDPYCGKHHLPDREQRERPIPPGLARGVRNHVGGGFPPEDSTRRKRKAIFSKPAARSLSAANLPSSGNISTVGCSTSMGDSRMKGARLSRSASFSMRGVTVYLNEGPLLTRERIIFIS